MPAIRNAEGPMSTPRRPAPRSSGTPMMWTGFNWALGVGRWELSLCLVRHRHAFARGGDDRRVQRGVREHRLQERLHLVFLVDDVVGDEDAAGRQARVH